MAAERCECPCHFPMGEKQRKAPLITDPIAAITACSKCSQRHPVNRSPYKEPWEECDDQC